MRNLLILAAAASLAIGCANRAEDEVGAAPDRGDTTAVASDTAQAVPTDSTMGQVPGAADTTMVSQDSTAIGVSPDSALNNQSAPTTDTTSTGAWTDSTGMSHDSAGMGQPSDSTLPANQ